MTEEIIAAEEPLAAPAPVVPLSPVASSERVQLIDILRGMALFGILAANIRGFAAPAAVYFTPAKYWIAFHDRLAQAFVDTFIQGKFINIFAFLFGVGFAVQLDRATARGGPFVKTYARRLGVLLLFGLVHGLLIWWGDILLAYALIGFFLFFFRKRADKTVMRWSIALMLVPVLFMLLFYLAATFGNAGPPPFGNETAAEIAAQVKIGADGTWAQVQAQRANDVIKHNWQLLPFFGIQLLGIFLAGLYAWRKRFFFPTPESLPKYRRTMFIALSLGITWSVLITVLRWIAEPPMMPTMAVELGLWTVALIATLALSLGYICLVIVLLNNPKWQNRLNVFAPLGRTALTNYLLQSIIGTLIFYSYGLGLFGKYGPAYLLPLTIVIYAAQVVASKWWLEHYRFGPVEWLWRRMTYPGPLPMKKDGAVAAETVAAA
ncbi:MAG TPA: DUF418 domain-containing protein [Thermoanaerobaculia bacterium]